MYTVYMHENKLNHKKYIGITSVDPKKRWGAGHGYKYQQYFWRAIQKHGWKQFEHIIIADNLTKNEAEQMEIDLIKKYDSTNPEKGYNIQNGGFTAGKHNESTKRKLSENHKGLMAGEKHHMYGKHHTEEACRKISEVQFKPVYQYDRYTGFFIARYQSTIEAEAILQIPNAHISATCLGKIKTSHGFVFRYECDGYKYGEPLPKNELEIVNTNEHNIAIKQYDLNGNFIRQFETIAEASRSTGASLSAIRKSLYGEIKNPKKYVWKYA